MRQDGTYEIYHIQVQVTGKWGFASLDHFGYPEDFNASGECWQKTGVHGVFDLAVAERGLKWMLKKHPTEKFRLVKRITFQLTITHESQIAKPSTRTGRKG